MKHVKDYELRGTARIYDDLTEMVDLAWKHGKEYGSSVNSGEWVGRELADWDAVKRAVAEPWDDALHEVRMMVEDLKGKVPPPEKITRSKAWSMHRGDVHVNRALTGEPYFLRTMSKRSKTNVPTNATVVCNVGNVGYWSYKDIFWRGAAAIAAVDLLEQANYRCEVWIYNLADYVNRAPGLSTSLCACRVKNAGDVLDIDHLVTATSAWFFRNVIFELRKTDPCYGHSMSTVSGSSHARLNKWDKYFDIETGTTPVVMPAPRTRDAAVADAKQVIEQVVTGQKEAV